MLKGIRSSAQRRDAIKDKDISRVNVDTTVQEKAIAFPTYARLCQKAQQTFVPTSQRSNVDLRQSNKRLDKKALFKLGVFARSRQIKKSKKADVGTLFVNARARTS